MKKGYLYIGGEVFCKKNYRKPTNCLNDRWGLILQICIKPQMTSFITVRRFMQKIAIRSFLLKKFVETLFFQSPMAIWEKKE